MRAYALVLPLFLAACGDGRAPAPADVGSAGAGGSGSGGQTGKNPSFETSPDDPAITRYAVGDVVSGALAFEGYLDGSTEKTTFTLEDLHDPDGKKGIDVIFVSTSNMSCPYCQAEAKALKIRQDNQWAKRRIAVVQLVHLDSKGELATPEDALAWRTATITHGRVAADPKLAFARVGSNAMPLRAVIDAKTLVLLYRQEGGGNASFLEAEAHAPEVP